MTNITMSIQEELLKKARKLAVEKSTTLTAMIRKFLEEEVTKDEYSCNQAQEKIMQVMEKGMYDLGSTEWVRDELHER